jgi:hypothetical protein
MVMNWSGGKVRNNIIYHNAGGASWGAGGLMVWRVPNNSAIVENNTIVGFNVAKRSHVSLKVFDVCGREVEDLVDGEMEAGEHGLVYPIFLLTRSNFFSIFIRQRKTIS